MKTIAIFCESLAFDGATFEGTDKYWTSYSELLLLLKARGVRAYFVTNNATYCGNGVFTMGYTLTKLGRPEDLIPVPDIKVDMVYDRGGFTGEDILTINPAEVLRLASDKSAMYEEFGELQPFSMTCESPQELEHAFKQITTGKVVVKDPTGYGGSGVYIGSRAEVRHKLAKDNASYPLLAQEMMDTSVGIPGITTGMHDMRITIGGGRIWSSFFRTPKQGEYRANVALGGSFQYIPHNRIPAAAIRMAKRIDEHFGSQPRHYAVDVAHTDKGWKLIELNNMPGIVPTSYTPETEYELNQLATYLVRLVRQLRPSVAVQQLYHTRLRPYLPELEWPRLPLLE
jgi:glutathione synthase/RimK-type ligase-like ATP-grasp enzyme